MRRAGSIRYKQGVMSIRKPEDFYENYAGFKAYERQALRPKHIRWYDREFWLPTRCDASMSVLEIGCGAGHFLSYLRHKGVTRFTGVDLDPKVVEFLAPEIAAHVRIADIREVIAGHDPASPFDRIAMLDVLEHFSPFEAVRLLQSLKSILAEDGLINIRVPNLSSPWGLSHQYGDLTHKAAYTQDSLAQLAQASGYEAVAFLPQKRGSPSKRIVEDIFHGVLSRLLTEAPAIWSANFIGVIKPCPTPNR